jgi:hypothetical protein
MTESAWWSAIDPDRLLDWLSRHAPVASRKRLLFAAACCQRAIPLVPDPRFRGWAAVAEYLTREVVPEMDLTTTVSGGAAFLERASEQFSDLVTAVDFSSLSDPRLSWFSVSFQVRRALAAADSTGPPSPLVRECAAHCGLVHEIFGPLPFRDIAAEPSWLTSDVLALARGIETEKAFDRMPILADALQDAGCTSDDVLNHCRAVGWEHGRGCWVVDLLLGRPWRE